MPLKFRKMCSLLISLIVLCSLSINQGLAKDLVVGLSTDYEPLVFKQEGKIVGIEADNARELASQLGMGVRFVELPFDKLLPALQSGDVDVLMSGLSITEQRKAKVAFTDPFMGVGQMAIIRADDVATFGFPRAIYRPGTRIGVEPNTTGAQFVAEAMPGAVVLDYLRPEQAFSGLRNKEIDVYIHDAPTSWRLANSGDDGDLFPLYRPLTREQLAWAVRKDDEELLQKLNQARAQLEQSGKLRAIQDYWIPVKVEVD